MAEALSRSHANCWRAHGPDLFEIRTTPSFAIGQRAFLILSDRGNVLWDCLTLLDAATTSLLKALGGLSAIAISHPHYYSAMHRWAEAFDAPVHLHGDDRSWVVRPSQNLVFWQDQTKTLQPGMTLIRCGGHFAGATVLHQESGEATLFSGDTIQVLPDRRSASFMRSYPQLAPLSAAAVERIAASLAPYRFTRMFGAFAGREILSDADGALRRSAARYVEAVSGRGPADAEQQAQSSRMW